MTRALRVAILGSASAGKTTLAARLARHYGTIWVPEYLREFVDTAGRLPVAADQIHIARTQVAREAAALPAARGYLFCDTTPLMTAVYSRQYFGGIDPELERLARGHGYDHTLVCAPELPWVPDGLHREETDVSGAVTGLLLEELAARGIAYTVVSGPAAERLLKVEQLLGRPATLGG
ncbi:AAA family ATPase [Pseudoduganella namucuonensis]|uniref:Nicotinamide-nucleotide adenylyltransferase, NadR type n=1 Tax=Pseudoduganella namucuonensis TaxID=1035707 RepID=A0A1I7JMC5_9BURK|nr:ATP-binding protein [Pseudoduganella namucuonensis]SFU86288.1 nicotinamide-nucleotide adenylyltransferase, NadR type [Pseudoduganella namucuonensis]